LLIPLFKIAPPLYNWRIRSKIYRWYSDVREIDSIIQKNTINGDAAAVRDRLKELEHQVASISVPLSYAAELYHLRLHIGFLHDRLERVSGQASQSERAS
jgi:hypothetical protein